MTRSRKILLVLAALVVLAIAFSGGSPLPSAGSLVSDANADRAAAAQARQQSDMTREALADPEAFAGELAAARAAVPPTAELGALISTLEQTVRDSGLTWVSGSPSRAADGEEPSWAMTMKVAGAPESVPGLLDRIQALPRLVVVDSVNMQGTTAEDGTASLALRFFTTTGDLEAFTPEEQALITGAADAPAAPTGDAPAGEAPDEEVPTP